MNKLGRCISNGSDNFVYNTKHIGKGIGNVSESIVKNIADTIEAEDDIYKDTQSVTMEQLKTVGYGVVNITEKPLVAVRISLAKE